MDVLVLDGKSYVKAGKAARELGYATDYVGQLCRSGKIKSHLIGRTWYVDQEELSTHKIEKKRSSRQKAREQVRKVLNERREETTNTYKNIAIRYDSDGGPLLPETRKLAVSAEPVRKEFAYEDRMKGDELEFFNKGNSVVMSGDIDVVDVTDGDFDESTTFLTPVLQKAKRATVITRHEDLSEEEESDENLMVQQSEDVSVPFKTFTEKLEEAEIDVDLPDSEDEPIQVAEHTPAEPEEEYTGFISYFVLIILISFVFFTFFLSKSMTFTHLGGNTSIENTSFSTDFDIVALKNRLKI
jgi:hypothetical protein